MKKKIFVIIPAFNEGKEIIKVIKGLKKEGYSNIVIVDDNSKDNTYNKVKKEKVHLLKHNINRGQGAALKTGIDYSLHNHADIIVTFDADGQHNPKEIKKLVDPIIKGKVDVVLGSRFLGKSKVPFMKKITLKGGVLFTWLFSGIKLTDTHNGFRALSKRAAEQIEIKQDRMEHASEIIDEIAKKNIKYKEVPVTIVYTDYSQSKGQSVLNSINIAAKLILRKLTR